MSEPIKCEACAGTGGKGCCPHGCCAACKGTGQQPPADAPPRDVISAEGDDHGTHVRLSCGHSLSLPPFGRPAKHYACDECAKADAPLAIARYTAEQMLDAARKLEFSAPDDVASFAGRTAQILRSTSDRLVALEAENARLVNGQGYASSGEIMAIKRAEALEASLLALREKVKAFKDAHDAANGEYLDNIHAVGVVDEMERLLDARDAAQDKLFAVLALPAVAEQERT